MMPNQKLLLYTIVVTYDVKVYSQKHELLIRKQALKEDFVAISKAFYIPEPEVKFYKTEVAPDDKLIFITDTRVTDTLNNCSFNVMRFYENFFRMIAEHKRDINRMNSELEVNILVYENN